MQDAHLAETQQSLIPIRPQHQQRQRQNQHFEGGENFDDYVDRKTGWRYYREPREKPAGSIFIFNFAVANFTVASELELMTACIICEMVVISVSWRESPETSPGGVDRTPTHNTHLCSTVCSQARNAHHALGSGHTGCSVIFVRLKRIRHLVLHISHPWFSQLPFTTSTSSSSFTLPSTTTRTRSTIGSR